MAKLLKRIILVVIICIIASTTRVYADESKPLGYEELSAQDTNSETDIDCSDWAKEEIIFATELEFLPDEFLLLQCNTDAIYTVLSIYTPITWELMNMMEQGRFQTALMYMYMKPMLPIWCQV